jgi:hypothetical protein
MRRSDITFKMFKEMVKNDWAFTGLTRSEFESMSAHEVLVHCKTTPLKNNS